MQGSFKLYNRFGGINTMDMSVEYEGFPQEKCIDSLGRKYNDPTASSLPPES